MVNGSHGFTITDGAFNNVQGARNSYHTENYGDNNTTNNGGFYVARPRRGRPHPAPRYDERYEEEDYHEMYKVEEDYHETYEVEEVEEDYHEVEEEYYANRPRLRMSYHPFSDPSYAYPTAYGGYGPEPPYPRREHYGPNDAYEPRHIPPRRQYGPAPQPYPGDYDPRYNPQHHNYRDDRQHPPPRSRNSFRARSPPAHYDPYHHPQSPHPQYYPQNSPLSGAPRPAPPPHMSSAPDDTSYRVPPMPYPRYAHHHNITIYYGNNNRTSNGGYSSPQFMVRSP